MHQSNAIKLTKNATIINSNFFLQQAHYFQEQEKWQGVISCCLSSLEWQSHNFESHYFMANAFLKLEQWQDTVNTLAKLLESGYDSALTRHKIAIALTRLGQISEADHHYSQIFVMEPNFERSHINDFDVQQQCGDFFFRKNNWHRAIAAYRQAIILRPESYWEHVNLGRSLHYMDQSAEAILVLEKAISLNQNDSFTYYCLARVLLEQNRLTDAIESCHKAAALTPNDLPGIKDLMAKIHSRKIREEEVNSELTGSSEFQLVDKIPGWEENYRYGKQLQLAGKLDEAVNAYHRAIIQNPLNSWSYHDLGDTNLKLNQWHEAIAAYLQAIKLNPDYFWSICNLGIAYRHIGDWESSAQLYQKLTALNPALNLPVQSLEETLRGWYDHLIQEGNQFLQTNKQKALYCYRQAIQVCRSNIHIPCFDIPREQRQNPKVLLIVDEHITQCLRYRVHQKIEQLDHAGFTSAWYPWSKVKEAKNQLAFFDVVIFYRVPAFPEVIQTILYAKRIKKVVFYEIDDLIFDPELFPDSIESYRGQISQEQHDDLTRGTILFQEAIRLCDLAIASTPPLQRQIEKLLGCDNCYLHRNALDSQNIASLQLASPKVKRDYISIFYGSGTKAHNSDFDELVASALARLLKLYPNVRLTLMGYLTIPPILDACKNQIDRIDLVQDIWVYYEFLKQADISIAVLHPTTVNNCKSELKWFEAAAFKVPCVVSNTEVYLDVVKSGQDGLIASNPDEWFTHLESLVKDEKRRNEIGTMAYQRVMHEYSIPVMADNLREIIAAGIERCRATGDLVMPSPRKKLLIVNVFYPPQSIGGATRVVKDNVDILTSQYSEQYEICVFTSDEGNHEPYQITEYSHQGVQVTKVSSPMMEGMDWQCKNPRMYEIFKQYLEVNQPELIHFHCVQRLTASVLEAAADLGIPYIVTAHDAWWISDHQFLVNENGIECNYKQNDPVIAAADSDNIAASMKRKIYLREQLNRAAEVLAVSEAFAEIYRQNDFPQTKANRNGIQPFPALPRKPSKTGKVRLAHIGGMTAHKGYFVFKETVEKADLKNTEIIVINHAQSPGTVDHGSWNGVPVTFLSKFSQEKMHELYSMIDVLVAPSMWPESFGLVTREAAAAGVWVVASNKGAIAEDIVDGENGNIVSLENQNSFLGLLQKLDSEYLVYQEKNQYNSRVRTTKEQVAELEGLYRKYL